MSTIATIDFHITCKCNQDCPYCWGPQDVKPEVDRRTAAAIIRKISETGARRIVFTGGDPLLRDDIGMLIRLARECNLEVALSTTGDELSAGFLKAYGQWIDLISLPIDGSCEAISSRTKKPGHFNAIMKTLDILSAHPTIDVKLATPITRHNLDDFPLIIDLITSLSENLSNQFFYNVFQTFPRSVSEQDWDDLIISDKEFQQLKIRSEINPPPFRVNWLGHSTLDRLYVMIFPNGHLTIPSGAEYVDFGPFLEIKDLERTIKDSDFDRKKHLEHSKGWSRSRPAI
jgi:MoaA/NifB/PqqE/SkfB family radical SAM enzyme